MANNCTIRAWYNTGFNRTNRPADPNGSWTEECFSRTFPALNILQHTQLNSIKIKASYPDVVDIDYIRLDPPYTSAEAPNHGNNIAFSYAYYIVTNVTMLNGDTALLSLIPDNLSTLGGWNQLKILDGITRRLSIKKTDDVYGRYTQEDDLLIPDRPLMIETETVSPEGEGTDVVYVESTVDLGVMGMVTESEVFSTRVGSNTPGEVTVPKTYANFHSPTKYSIANTPTAPANERLYGRGNKTVVFPIEFNENYSAIYNRAIEQVRGLGIESVIIQTAVIPSTLVVQRDSIVTLTNQGDNAPGVLEWYEDVEQNTAAVGQPNKVFWDSTPKYDENVNDKRRWIVCSELTGAWRNLSTNFNLEYSDQYDNLRVLYGEMNRIGIITNAGNRLEVKPEDIVGDSGNVSLVVVADPHLNGKPYFRFRYMNGEDGLQMTSAFFRNCVSGMQWKSIPIIYNEKSGNVLDKYNFLNEKLLKNVNYETQSTLFDENAINSGINNAIGVGSGSLAAGIFGGNPAYAALTAGTGITGAFIGLGSTNAMQEAQATQFAYESQRDNERYLTSQNVVAPQIDFPYQNEGYRDFFGESVVVYRYRPTTADLRKMDKTLTMYGYATSQPVTTDIIDNRNHFVYVEANITVGNNVPQWLANAVASEISNGVRLWKVKPDTRYYEKGGNV